MVPDQTAQRVIFLLGAGASVEADVPDTKGFITQYAHFLRGGRWIWKEEGISLYKSLCGRIEAWSRRPENRGRQLDVESLLESLAMYRKGPQAIHTALFGKVRSPRRQAVKTAAFLELFLKDFIRERGIVAPAKTDYLRPYLRYISDAQPLGPVEIFSVNYDSVMEQFLERNGKTYTDGFELEWKPSLFDDPPVEVRLYKLHGSVNWFATPFGRVLKVPIKGTLRRIELLSSEWAETLMLYPTEKFLYTATFLELFRRFQLALDQTTWVVAVGYTFRDEQITRSLTEAARRNPGLQVILIGPGSDDVYESQLRSVQASFEAVTFDSEKPTISSPLSGRVARLPFRYGTTLPLFFTEILPLMRDGRQLESNAQSAEIYGSTNLWKDVARKYLQAGFIEKALTIEKQKMRLDSEEDSWRLGYLLEKAVVLWAHEGPSSGIPPWDAAVGQLRDMLANRGEVGFSFLGSTVSVRTLYALRFNPEGQMVGGQTADSFLKIANEALEVANRCYKLAYLEDRRVVIKSAIDFLARLREDVFLPFTPMNSAEIGKYESVRPLWVRQKLRRIKQEIEGVRPPNFDEVRAANATSALSALEKSFLVREVFPLSASPTRLARRRGRGRKQ